MKLNKKQILEVILGVIILTLLDLWLFWSWVNEDHKEYENTTTHPIVIWKQDSSILEEEVEVVEVVENDIIPKDSEMYLFAQCILAEAENQDDVGKRLVIDVILNRCRLYNKTIKEVILQKNQFECVSNKYIYTRIPNEHIYNLIQEEMNNPINEEILYFRTDHYHTFGTPVLKHQDHYFSK